MSGASPPRDLLLAEQIDAACDRFEADWLAERHPRIEEELSTVAVEDRPELFRALLAVEVELRLRAGQRLTSREYEQRFPDWKELIRDVFLEVKRGQQTTSPDDPKPPAGTISLAAPAADTSLSQPERSADAPVEVPTQLGRFEILELLGQGAFGTVYKARDPKLDRIVAVKVPQDGVLKTADDRERFLREARAAANLSHQHICSVHEVGETDGRDYIVMGFIDGKPLSELISTGKIQPRQAVQCVRKLAGAFAEAHLKGIVHRDIKPSNIMINRKGEPVVMDFGLARLHKPGDVQITHSGQIMGSPAYMSPEQARGAHESIGPASDIYSLGVVLYELLCGQRPFKGTVTEVLGQILHVEPPPPSSHKAGIDPVLEAICLKAMAKDSASRYRSMQEFAEALSGYLKGQATLTTQGAATGKTTDAGEANTDADESRLTEMFAAAVQEQRSLMRHAVREAAREGAKSARPPWAIIGILSALAALMMLSGIWFFVRKETVTVVIQIPIDTSDPSLTFFLDEKPIDPAALAAPIELKPGEHELVVNKDNTLFKRFLFNVGKADNQPVVVQDVTPARPPDPPPVAALPESPLDLLNSSDIPAPERFPWQPPELVAVFGKHAATHWGAVHHIAVSPNGALLASGGEDAVIHLSDFSTQLIGTLSGHVGPVRSLTFVNKDQLLSAGDDGTLRLWDLRNRQEARQFTGHQGRVLTVAVTPDGTRVLSGGDDATIRLWDIETGEELRQFNKHTLAVWRVCVAADGQRALSGGDDHALRFWDLETGEDVVQFENELLGPFQYGATPCRALALSPDGARAACGYSEDSHHFATMRLFDTATGKEVSREKDVTNDGHGMEIRDPAAQAFSPDGGLLLGAAWSPADGNALLLWDGKTGALNRKFGSQTTGATAVAFSPDGRRAYTGSRYGRLRVWDVETGQDLFPRDDGHESFVSSVALAPDGRRLLTGGEDLTVRLWKTSAPQRELQVYRAAEPWTAYSPPWHACFTPGGDQALLFGGVYTGHFARLWNLDEWQQVGELRQPTDVSLASSLFLPEGRELLSKFDTGLAIHDGFTGLALTGGNRAVYTGHERNLPHTRRGAPVVQLWDINEDRILKTITPFPGFMGVAASRNQIAVTHLSDGAVKLYDVELNEQLSFDPGTGPVMEFSPRGDAFATANAQGRIILWSPQTGEKLREIKLPGRVSALGFDATGRYLVTGNANGTAYLLRLAGP